MIQKILKDKNVLAIILIANYEFEGIEFFRPNEFSKLLYDLKKLTLNKKIYCLDYNSFTPGLKKIFSKKFF